MPGWALALVLIVWFWVGMTSAGCTGLVQMLRARIASLTAATSSPFTYQVFSGSSS
jgi:hypothetical protein